MQNLLITAPGKRQPNWIQRFFRQRTFLGLLILIVIAGCMAGLAVAKQVELSDEAQQVSALQNYSPSVVTKIYADDGKTVIGELALERRIPLTHEEIPLRMKQAFMAIEDSRFYSHFGVDPIRIIGAFIKNLQSGRRAEGGSTITQQLARILFLSPEKTYTRKIKEALIAMQIERYYTKEQIMTLYCNQIFLGGGAYGIEAGAQYYFGKSVKDLALEEMAMLAALPKAPADYSPRLQYKSALARRNLVLEQMVEEGFISRSEAESAKAKPIVLNPYPRTSNNDSPAAYFVEEVRQYLEQTYGTQRAQAEGLSVYTTLDVKAQQYAVQAVRKGLHEYDRRHRRWRGNLRNVFTDEGIRDLSKYHNPDWANPPEKGQFIMGLILSVSSSGAEVSFGNYRALVTAKETGWTGQSPDKLFKRGDLAVFEIKEVNENEKRVSVSLEQIPETQGALVAIDVKTGEVKAMVGGYDFNTNKFNNATQANRQTGSAFKPFIYAAAIENGFTADDPIEDTPFIKGEWEPHNYDDTYKGIINLRTALAQSRNIPAVRLLDRVGIRKGVQMVKRFGLPNPMAPFLPSALGATEEPLIAMVSAYSVFPNKGIRAIPHYIRKIVDRNGQVIYEWEQEQTRQVKVIDPYVAAQMVSLMRGVVDGGTATRIKSVPELAKRPIAGKTGTTNSFTDAWFIGYTPSLCTGVWIGYPGEKRPLGSKEAGSVAALPMWIDFMQSLLKDKAVEEFPPVPEAPPEIRALQAQRRREMTPQEDMLLTPEGTAPGKTMVLTNSEDSSKSPTPSKAMPPALTPTSAPGAKPGANAPGRPRFTTAPNSPPASAQPQKKDAGTTKKN